MSAKVIQLERYQAEKYQEAKAGSDENSEYRLLEEIMRALFGPLLDQPEPALQPVTVRREPTRRR